MWPKYSDAKIAEICGVSTRTAFTIRQEMQPRRVSVDPALPGAERTVRIGTDGVTRTVSERKPDSSVVVDATELQYPVPPPAMVAWERRSEVQDILNQIGSLRSLLKVKNEAQDLLWREVSFPTALAAVTNLYQQVKLALPHAVCPACQGQKPDACTFCFGRGVVSEFAWTSQAMQEAKTIRAKAMKKTL
jgi:hypothetical protein